MNTITQVKLNDKTILQHLLQFRADSGISSPTSDEILTDNQRLLEHEAVRRGRVMLQSRRVEVYSPPPFHTLADILEVPKDRHSYGLAVYSRIGQTAVQKKLANACLLYDILQHRARARGGQARFNHREVIDYAQPFGISRSRVLKALDQGEGVFWSGEWLRSKEKVCISLGIDSAGPRIDLPDEAYRNVDHYRAYIYSAFWTENRGDYARSTLMRLFGASHATLRRWEKLACIRVSRRLMEALLPVNEAQQQELESVRSERYWLEVDWHRRPVLSTGLLDGDNELLPDAVTRYQYTLERGRQKTVRWVWQTTNGYYPTRTRLALSSRSRYIKCNLKDPSKEQRIKGSRSRLHRKYKMTLNGRRWEYSLWATSTYPTLSEVEQRRELCRNGTPNKSNKLN